jgi:hypothetical protein
MMQSFNLAWKYFCFLGIAFFGMGVYFLLIRPGFVMQPEDIRVAKLTGEQIKAFSPDLFLWLTYVIRAWGSFCLSLGILVFGISYYGMRQREKWAYLLLITSLIPLLSLFFLIQFLMKGDFVIPLALGLILSVYFFYSVRKNFNT